MPQSALIILDVQKGILSRASVPPTYLAQLSSAMKSARANGIKIIYTTVSFRPGHPEIPSRNTSFSTVAKNNLFLTGSEEASIPSEIQLQEDDIQIVKKRVSAFTGSGLDVILRGLEIENLVLVGISTSGAVLSTLTEARDRDFDITILSDLCIDPDDEVHRVLLEKVFKRHYKVTTSKEWLKDL